MKATGSCYQSEFTIFNHMENRSEVGKSSWRTTRRTISIQRKEDRKERNTSQWCWWWAISKARCFLKFLQWGSLTPVLGEVTNLCKWGRGRFSLIPILTAAAWVLGYAISPSHRCRAERFRLLRPWAGVLLLAPPPAPITCQGAASWGPVPCGLTVLPGTRTMVKMGTDTQAHGFQWRDEIRWGDDGAGQNVPEPSEQKDISKMRFFLLEWVTYFSAFDMNQRTGDSLNHKIKKVWRSDGIIVWQPLKKFKYLMEKSYCT